MKKLLIIPAVALVAMMLMSFAQESNMGEKKDTTKVDTIKVGAPVVVGDTVMGD